MSGKFEILSWELSGKCQGNLVPSEHGNPVNLEESTGTGTIMCIICPTLLNQKHQYESDTYEWGDDNFV